MSPSTFTLLAVAAVVSFIYSFFTDNSTGDDDEQQLQQQQSPPPSRNQSADHRPHRDSDYSYFTLIQTTHSHSTPSASTHTHPRPSYQQQPRIEPRAAQATASTKENPERSHHVHRHGLASCTRPVPTSAAQAQLPQPTKSSPSRVHQAAHATSGHLGPLHCTSLTSPNTWDTPLTPLTPPSTHTPYTAKQTYALATQTKARTPTRTDYENSLHRSDIGLSSSVLKSYQTNPTLTHTSYPAQLSRTTSTTPAKADYDSSLQRSNFASPSVREFRQTPSTTRTRAFYSTQQTSTGLVGTTVRTPIVADYDDYDDMDMGPSPYSYLRAPSPDAPPAHVSPPTVSPHKHSRTQSSSSDSDYPGPSSRRRAVLGSRGLEVHDAIEDAQDRKKAMELREQAKRSAHDMREARDRAKIAQRKGNTEAETEHRQEARAHESAKKNSDKRAASIFFRVNNKVRIAGIHPLRLGSPHLTFRRFTYCRLMRKERSTFTICMSRRLWSTPRRNSSLLYIGTMTRSPSSSVCILCLSN